MLAAAGAACVDLGGDLGTTVWETQLAPTAAYADLSGQAAAVSNSAGTDVGVAVDGAVPGDSLAWSVRLGSCATPGQQIGSDADYPALAVGDSGSALAETHFGSRLAASGQYQLTVRVSVSDTSRAACGNLAAR